MPNSSSFPASTATAASPTLQVPPATAQPSIAPAFPWLGARAQDHGGTPRGGVQPWPAPLQQFPGPPLSPPAPQYPSSIFGGPFESLVKPLPANIQAVLAKPVAWFKEHGTGPGTGCAPLTNIAFLLDRSTSMKKDKGAAIEGFNAQVEVVREGAKGAGATTFTEVQFDTVVDIRCVAGDLAQLQPLNDETYLPNGWTALYDALGDTIAALLSTPGIDNPNTAMLVTLFTDGEENRSSRYDSTTLKALVERLEATGRWTFALVGPLQSVTGLAQLLSVRQKNIAGYDVTSVQDKRKAFAKVAGASASFMTMRSVGGTQSSSLYDDKDLQC